MLVVHGIWAYGALQLWAEDPSLPAAAPARGGRPSRAPRPHPFAAPAAELADALACLPDPLPDLAVKAVDDELTLRLPAVGDEPYPSPQVGREPPAGKAALAAWRVPALVFEPSAAGPLLAVLGDQHPDLAAGATLAYLAAVERFADDLAAASSRARWTSAAASTGRQRAA